MKEYKIVRAYGSDVQDILNGLSKEGWTVVTMNHESIVLERDDTNIHTHRDTHAFNVDQHREITEVDSK